MTTSNEVVGYIDRAEGRVAYEVVGKGPLVVCVPGMGDLRSTWRYLTPPLVDAGFRVATLDLRGHGDSDTTFTSHDDVAAATDVVALIEALGGRALLIGNSMGAGAAALAAAERPDLVRGLVLIGPFVRNPPTPAWKRAAFRVALLLPWGPKVWPRAYRSFHKTAPADLQAHIEAITRSMRRPGAWRAFVKTTQTSHAPVEARLDGIKTPALVIMGSGDPDFADPEAEARWIADRIGADVLVVPDAGHYPQSERPDAVGPAVVAFGQRLARA